MLNQKIDIILRPAVLTDAKRISELMDELGYHAPENLIINKLKEISESNADEVYIAEIEGKVIGVISCHLTQLFHESGKAGRITSLAVSSNARRKGVGKKLIEKADQYFRKNGCTKAEVTSGDHRKKAHEFYDAQGFKLDDRRFLKHYI